MDVSLRDWHRRCNFPQVRLDHQLPPNAVPRGMAEGYADVRGGRMRYLHGGTGPPLVLIHGLLGYSFSWRYNLEELSQHRTLYAVDLLGTGYSERPDHLEPGLRNTAERMIAFCDAVGLRSFDLLGTSHGGPVAMLTAALAVLGGKPRVTRLLLIAPVNPWSEMDRLVTRAFGRPWVAGLVTLAAPALLRLGKLNLSYMYGDPRRIRPETLPGYVAPFRIPGTLTHVLAIVRCWDEGIRDLQESIPHIRHIPAYLQWGSVDRIVSPASAERLAAQFDQANLQILDGAGHLPYEELPELFNAGVIEFLSSSPPAGQVLKCASASGKPLPAKLTQSTL